MLDYELKIKELGGTIAPPGIHWRWSHFPNEETAKKFIKWLEDNDFEHRGIYPPAGRFTDYSVRFRPF